MHNPADECPIRIGRSSAGGFIMNLKSRTVSVPPHKRRLPSSPGELVIMRLEDANRRVAERALDPRALLVIDVSLISWLHTLLCQGEV